MLSSPALPKILVAAGGYGSRLPDQFNPHASKSLILAPDGRPLLSHTLRNLVEGSAAERIIVVTRFDIRDKISEIAGQFPGVTVEVDDKMRGVRYIPTLMREEVHGDIFGLVCGHAPPTIEHLPKMSSLAKKKGTPVVSIYSDDGSNQHRRIAVDLNGDEVVNVFGYTDEITDSVKPYLSNPFILTPEIIDRMESIGFSQSFSALFALRKRECPDFRIFGVNADFPKEFDYPDQLEAALRFVHAMFAQSAVAPQVGTRPE